MVVPFIISRANPSISRDCYDSGFSFDADGIRFCPLFTLLDDLRGACLYD